MSFSSEVKTELAAVSISKKHCQRAELAGIIYTASTLFFSGRGMGLSVSTEHIDVVKRAISLLERTFGIEAELSAVEQPPKRALTYVIKISGDESVRAVMNALGLRLEGGIQPDASVASEMLGRDCCKKAFLRGAFLGGGSMTDPGKAYHLEFVTGTRPFADILSEVLSSLGLRSKSTERKESCVVYIKEAEQIIEFFTHAGAYSTILKLENIRILKGINNDINRAYNCESANIDRTIASAEEQIALIKCIADAGGIDKLSAPLKRTAELRLNNPSASLSELAAIDGESSRSAINHRMRKLRQIANSISIKEDN